MLIVQGGILNTFWNSSRFLSCPVRSSDCFSYYILFRAAIGIPGFLIAPRNVPWSVVTVSSIWDGGGVISNYTGAQQLLMSHCHMLGLHVLLKMSVTSDLGPIQREELKYLCVAVQYFFVFLQTKPSPNAIKTNYNKRNLPSHVQIN